MCLFSDSPRLASQSLRSVLVALTLLAAVTSSATARTVTLIVAADDSTTDSKNEADYVCDGIDDQVEVQNAINALPTVGGTILLMEGTYVFENDVDLLKDNVTLMGQGYGTVITRDYLDGGHIILIGSSTTRVDGARVEKIRFDRGGRTTSGYAVYVSKASNFYMTNCHFENVWGATRLQDVDGATITENRCETMGNAFLFSGASNVDFSNNVGVDIGTNSQEHFVYVAAGYRHDTADKDETCVNISNNTIENGTGIGVTLYNPLAGTTVTGISITGNVIKDFRTGISVTRGMFDVNVSGNVVTECEFIGIDIKDEDITALISDNQIAFCESGIYLGRNTGTVTEKIEVRGNTSSDNIVGMYVRNAKKPIIVNNTFRDNNAGGTAAYGIYVDNKTENALIQGNTFQGHNGTGASYHILIFHNTGTPNPVIRDNTFWGSGHADERGITLIGATNELAVLTNNYLHNFDSVSRAIGSTLTNGDYTGTHIYDGSTWHVP